MTNSCFVLMQYAQQRNLGLNYNPTTGVATFRDKKTGRYICLKTDIDVKVTIEKVEDWYFERGEE